MLGINENKVPASEPDSVEEGNAQVGSVIDNDSQDDKEEDFEPIGEPNLIPLLQLNTATKQPKNSNATHAIAATFVLSVVSYAVFYFLFPKSLTENIEMSLLEDLMAISQNVSAADYIFRLVDIKFKEITLLDRIRSKMNKTPLTGVERDASLDRCGIIVGFLAAVAISTFILVKNTVFSGPIFNLILKVMNTVVTTVSCYLGLGNRVGQTIKSLHLLQKEGDAKKVNYSLSIALGGIAAVIFAGLSIAFHFSTGGIPSLIFQTVNLVSSFASASGYIGRIFDALFSDRSFVQVIKDIKNDKEIKASWNWEKKLTVVGVILGFALAAALIVAVTHGAGLVLLAGIGLHAATTSTACTSFLMLSASAMLVSRVGGLFNRLGQFLDKCSKLQTPLITNNQEKQGVSSTSLPFCQYAAAPPSPPLTPTEILPTRA